MPDLALARRLMVHEAEVQVTGVRLLRDLGDGWLLHDPADPEPFWNRLVAPRWPTDPAAFDRRLDEVVTLFASFDRVPHVRPLPLGNEPADLAERLVANGFDRLSADLRMVLRDVEPSRSVVDRHAAAAHLDGRLRVVRLPGTGIGPPRLWASEASLVLAEAFDVDPYRRAALETDLLACAVRPECSILLVYDGEEPVATARRTTTRDGSYLSSIGTRPGWRGRGHGSLATALAVMDAVAGSDAPGVSTPSGASGASGASRAVGGPLPFVHLAVDVRNDVARRLYERLGFAAVGEGVPDLLAR